MSDEDAFIAAVQSSNDPLPRLVYADWLEERDDPRAEYLRLQQQLAQCKQRLSELHASIDPSWLRKVKQSCTVVLLEFVRPNELRVYMKLRRFTGMNAVELDELIGPEFFGRFVIKSGVPPHEAEAIAALFSDCALVEIEVDPVE